MNELPDLSSTFNKVVKDEITDKTIISVLINFAKRVHEVELDEESVIDFYKSNYFFADEDIIEQTCKLINNYIRLVSFELEELNLIDRNIEKSINFIKNKDKDSYLVKKHTYFIEINKLAKQKTEKYIFNDLKIQLKERMKTKKSGLAKHSLLDKTNIFSWFKDYYNPDFDFSTHIKLFDSFSFPIDEVKKYSTLKQNNEDEYYRKIEKHVENNSIKETILRNVENHYLLSEKTEVFKILFDLFTNNKYQTLVSLGAIQVEGLFYDFCSAIKGGKRNQEEGTIKTKLEKYLATTKFLN